MAPASPRVVTVEGDSVDDAVRLGLTHLSVRRDQVQAWHQSLARVVQFEQRDSPALAGLDAARDEEEDRHDQGVDDDRRPEAGVVAAVMLVEVRAPEVAEPDRARESER